MAESTDGSGAEHPRPRRRHRRLLGLVAIVTAVAAVAVTVGVLWPTLSARSDLSAAATATASVSEHVARLSPKQVALLPEARYNAVIPGLAPYQSVDVPKASATVYTISSDIAIYSEKRTPVARFAFTDFAGHPTVIVPVRVEGPWTLVLTPARQTLPSQTRGAAPAQTVGWVQSSQLRKVADVGRRIVVSVGKQELSIETLSDQVVQTFSVGVGVAGTPTPTGVTGYLQERYLDPAQGQSTYPINLTSLHSSAQDEPFQGEDGGLIGIHYFPVHTGNVSHGCIRLPEDAIKAVDNLPAGTSITILP